MTPAPKHDPQEYEQKLVELRELEFLSDIVWLESEGEKNMPLLQSAYQHWCRHESGQVPYYATKVNGTLMAVRFGVNTTPQMRDKIAELGFKFRPDSNTVSGIPTAEVGDVLIALDDILNERDLLD